MSRRVTSRFGGPRRGVTPSPGSSTWVGPYSTPNLRAWYPDENSSIAAGTDTTGRYRTANIPCHASATFGGTIAQGTAASQPAFSYCKGGKARNYYRSSTITSSLAASLYTLMHQFSFGCSFGFYFKVRTLVNADILNTKATSGTGTGVGITVAAVNTGNLRVAIGDGTANQSVTTTSGTLTANVGHTVIVRMSQTEAKKVEIFIDGVSAGGEATALSISPSASDPGATLTISPAAAGITAFVSSLMLWETYISNADVTACHKWLMANYGQEYSTLAEVVADVATLGNAPAEIFSFNVSGIVSNLAAHTATGVSSPATSTNASYNGKYVFDCATGDYYTADTLSTNMSGTDKPWACIVVGNQATTDTTNKTLCATGSGTGGQNQHKRLEFSASNLLRAVSVDDAAASDVDPGQLAIGTGARIVGMGNYGTTVGGWSSLTVDLDDVANDVGATTVDRFTLFALVQAGALAASTELNGKAACAWVWDTKGINFALYYTIYPALAGEFGL